MRIITFIIIFIFTLSFSLFYFVSEEDTEDEMEEVDIVIESELNGESEAPEEEKEYIEPELDGIFQWIGKEEAELIEYYGEPTRRDMTPYGYEWYVYKDGDYYIQHGLDDGIVVTVYTNDEKAEIGLVQIGDSYEQVERYFPFEASISLEYMGSSYQFQLNEEELAMTPIAKYGDIWLQFYFDIFEDRLSSVRLVSKETLLLQRPYSIVYRGELLEADALGDEEWEAVQEGRARQIFDLTNHIRLKHDLPALEWDHKTAIVAYDHSQDMYENEYFSHTSPTKGELRDRLEAEKVIYQLAGENIAAKYVDSIAAVEGWLNSEGHRVNLLNEEFTHLGVGVYRDFYTQNFMTPW